VWHNVSFDRHVVWNHGIEVKGFGGDTMHMARLWDAARSPKWGGRGYGLEALSDELVEGPKKTSMKEIFAVAVKKKDGTDGKKRVLPPLDELQASPDTYARWVEYSVHDAYCTWHLRESLHAKLLEMPWLDQCRTNKEEQDRGTMWDMYYDIWRPFGYLLTDMEHKGIKVNRPMLREIEVQAEKDKEAAHRHFAEWADSVSPGAKHINVNSDQQKQQLLFAPCTNKITGEDRPLIRDFDAPNTEGIIMEGKSKPLKNIQFPVQGLGLPCSEYTTAGWPSVSNTALRKLVDAGVVEGFFSNDGVKKEAGTEAASSVQALCDGSQIQTLLTNFVRPLQGWADTQDRVHGSLNLNTETGRLSSRNPNLQNQPALEKDRYRIRSAFCCDPEKALVVADYGQLELRLLAHLSGCVSMIDAFQTGGDFHSRTAISMYPAIQEAIEKGDVLLEWNEADGVAPVPLVKDIYSSERRKAKTLNFSIAYGKTAHGLAKDWGVSVKEAQRTIELWYAARPEVLAWQKGVIAEARVTGSSRTLMGRYRPLPGINSKSNGPRRHAERAAINTPVQGGAADVVVMAMVALFQDPMLADLGYELILQIHDEVILEGPKEHVEQALARVKEVMESPMGEQKLLVSLNVDGKWAETWYDAK